MARRGNDQSDKCQNKRSGNAALPLGFDKLRLQRYFWQTVTLPFLRNPDWKKQNFWEIILWKENPSELSDEISRRTAYKTFPFQLWLNTMQLLINVIPDRINLLHLVLAVGDHIRSNCITAKNERVFSAQNCIQDAWTRLNKLISALPLWCKTSGISELQFSALCYPEEKMDVEKESPIIFFENTMVDGAFTLWIRFHVVCQQPLRTYFVFKSFPKLNKDEKLGVCRYLRRE